MAVEVPVLGRQYPQQHPDNLSGANRPAPQAISQHHESKTSSTEPLCVGILAWPQPKSVSGVRRISGAVNPEKGERKLNPVRASVLAKRGRETETTGKEKK